MKLQFPCVHHMVFIDFISPLIKFLLMLLRLRYLSFTVGGSGKRFHKFLAEDYCYKITTVNIGFDLLGHKFSHTGTN